MIIDKSLKYIIQESLIFLSNYNNKVFFLLILFILIYKLNYSSYTSFTHCILQAEDVIT